MYNHAQYVEVILYKEFKVTDEGHVHEYGDLIKEVSATCTTKGMKAHYECSICHMLFDENKTEKTTTDLEIAIDPTAHKFGEWKTEQKANCATAGVKAHKDCTACHKHFDADGKEVTDAELKIEKLAPTVPIDPNSPSEKEGLSGGAIAGIVIGSVVVVGVGGFALFWFVIKKKKWADLITLFKKSE